MMNIFELLDKKERRSVILLCILLLISAVLFIFVAMAEKRDYFRSLEDGSMKEKNYERVLANRDEKELEWQRWQQALLDMEELASGYFYTSDEGIQGFRKDIQRLFGQSSVRTDSIRFDYSVYKEEKITKVTASFNLNGSYLALKKFIHSVENIPRFIVVERIDFLNSDEKAGSLKLKVILAGYYAN